MLIGRKAPGSGLPQPKTVIEDPHRYLKGWEREDIWKTDIENTKQTWIEQTKRRLEAFDFSPLRK